MLMGGKYWMLINSKALNFEVYLDVEVDNKQKENAQSMVDPGALFITCIP